MKIKISVRYRTNPGEALVLTTPKFRYEMACLVGDLWSIELTDRAFRAGAEFRFEVCSGTRTVRKEWRSHSLRFPKTGDLEIRSVWTERPENPVLQTPAFRDVLLKRPERDRKRRSEGNLIFVVSRGGLLPTQSLAIVGNGKTLGGWDKPIIMNGWDYPQWSVDLDVKDAFEYKFVVVETATGKILAWEEGPNHLFAEMPRSGSTLVITEVKPRFSLPQWRGAGIAVPVFSLRSKESFGCGDFHDLKMLAGWASSCGQKVIQILPINDTTLDGSWQDSYPYNSISAFALHPQYLHLPSLGIEKDARYLELQKELEALPGEDYEKVNRAKKAYALEAFKKDKSVLETPQYKAFEDANAFWLLPYAKFRAEKDNCPEAFHCFVQYHLHLQLKEAADYARSLGIILKGDLPIGVSRDGCDVRTNPELFHLDSQAGAPPDAFATDGQNWGFPTYNWEAMAREGYLWWKRRLGKMSEYFDAYRIDHILGFFRIWEIPLEYKSGLMGHFNPALPYSREELEAKGLEPDGELFLEDPRKKGYYHPRISSAGKNPLYEEFFYGRNEECWKESAMAKLPALTGCTGMLACGEDLGMIPACVPDVMESLDILSLEIQRMPKQYGREFADTASYPHLSVCSTGTHDTSTLRAWWEENPEASQRYYNAVLGHEGDAPAECTPEICREIIRLHLESPSMFAIFPLQDWLSIDGAVRYQGKPEDERINIPANPRHYWRYRMHCTLESLFSNDALTSLIRGMTVYAGRA